MFVPRFLAAVLAVTFTAATVHASCTPPPSGIVAWWPGEGNTTDIIGGDTVSYTHLTLPTIYSV